MDNFKIIRADKSGDALRLKTLYNKVFGTEEQVGELAEVMYNHLPDLPRKNWFALENLNNKDFTAALVLIPWEWNFEGVTLKVAEQGIVGTDSDYQGQGFISQLNREFDAQLDQENYDLAVIQGIPGFYQNFGYRYSIPLENHINLELNKVSPNLIQKPSDTRIRLASEADIPLLMTLERAQQTLRSISTLRKREDWNYIFSKGVGTDYSSDFYILESEDRSTYIRIFKQGFGDGLIVGEVCANLNSEELDMLLPFLTDLAGKRNKPYIRFNEHSDSIVAQMLYSRGAVFVEGWAWQVKIPNLLRFISKCRTVLERRLKNSPLNQFSGTLRMDSFREQVDIICQSGQIVEVKKGEGECTHTISMSSELLPLILLGAKASDDILKIRPDLMTSSSLAKDFLRILFPHQISWINLRY